MNKWTGTGRFVKDPELRYTPAQKAVANFSIAVERRMKTEDGPTADFFECTAWGKTAEHIAKYWKKGMKAALSGRVETETWTGKDDVKRTTTKIVVEEIEFCEKKQDQAQPDGGFAAASDEEELPFKF